MFLGKLIILGVTGDALSYKAISIVKHLVEQQADVHVLMTKNAAKFINPRIFEIITHNKCLVDTCDEDYNFENDSAILIRSADLVVVAPATANTISRLSRGMADDILTKIILSCNCIKLVVPSLSASVYKNPIVQDNIDILKAYGFNVISPDMGDILHNNYDTASNMVSEQEIFDHIERFMAYKKDLIGKKVVVTAGPTYEKIDSLKWTTSMSTGRTGYEIAKACMLRGADVTLVTGRTNLLKPNFINIIEVLSAKEMFMAVNSIIGGQDIVVNTASIVDYAPDTSALQKIISSEENINITLRKNPDILEYVTERKRKNQFICGMSYETKNVMEKARGKLKNQKLDMIVASNLKSVGAQFTSDTHVVTMITKDSEVKLNKMSKREVAHRIIDQILLEINLKK